MSSPCPRRRAFPGSPTCRCPFPAPHTVWAMSLCHVYTNSPTFTNKLHPHDRGPGVTPGRPLEPSHLTGPQQSSSLYPHTLPWSCAHGGLSRHPHGTESVESSLLQALWGPVSRAVPSPQAVPSRASQACASRPAAASSSQPLLPPSCPSLPHGALSLGCPHKRKMSSFLLFRPEVWPWDHCGLAGTAVVPDT